MYCLGARFSWTTHFRSCFQWSHGGEDWNSPNCFYCWVYLFTQLEPETTRSLSRLRCAWQDHSYVGHHQWSLLIFPGMIIDVHRPPVFTSLLRCRLVMITGFAAFTFIQVVNICSVVRMTKPYAFGTSKTNETRKSLKLIRIFVLHLVCLRDEYSRCITRSSLYLTV